MIRLAPSAPVLAFLAVVASVLSGCGSEDPLGRQAVSGTVMLDGQPLPYGTIRFEPSGSETATASGGIISDGSYEIPTEQGLPPGTYKVSITASDPPVATDPADPDAAMRAASEAKPKPQPIPPRYNANTELTAEVTAGGANQFGFTLESNEK